MQLTPEQTSKLLAIFTPYHASKIVDESGTAQRLAHYTSAASAVEIIRNRTLWLRNTGAMADYLEVQYGFAHLVSFFRRTIKQTLSSSRRRLQTSPLTCHFPP